MRGTV